MRGPERKELLGTHRAAVGPEASATAASEKDCVHPVEEKRVARLPGAGGLSNYAGNWLWRQPHVEFLSVLSCYVARVRGTNYN